MRILANIGKPAIPHLIKALKHANMNVRYHAATSLGFHKSLHDTSAVTPLTSLLDDTDTRVRSRAIASLIKIESNDVEVLRAITKKLFDSSPSVRWNAANALQVTDRRDDFIRGALQKSLKLELTYAELGDRRHSDEGIITEKTHDKVIEAIQSAIDRFHKNGGRP